tara:strand:- start:521 stop:898 length:378 start_codon:yes stop_codon:yes gene_type:complete
MLIGKDERRLFRLEEANSLLPLVSRITSNYKSLVENKMLILEQVSTSKPEILNELEAEIDTLIDEWKSKMRRLGAKPAGLWHLDFDHGSGYYCWKYPEEKISYEHAYREGFSSRKRVSESLLQFE